MTPDARRERTERAGRAGEFVAEIFLRLKDYRILARRFRNHGGEIDLIALAPGFGGNATLAAIEVKRRAHMDMAAIALNARQRKRIVQAARGFLASRPQFDGASLRFDLILVAPGRLPRHLISAWQEE